MLRWGKNRIFDGLLCHLIHSNNTNPNMVCSSPHDSIHSSVCSGDSGSSLICMQDSKPVVAGVASQATVKQCGTRNSLAIFTKVMPYLSWIKQCMVSFVCSFQPYIVMVALFRNHWRMMSMLMKPQKSQ